MPQQEMLCCNKVEAEPRLEVKNVTTFHNFVVTQNEKDCVINVVTKK